MSWPGRTAGTSSPIRSDRLLVDSGPGIPPVSDHAVYGVYVTGAGLLYVGQTRDARRRLRDLPVGESHHLATTVPPEIWERVLVIQWPALITHPGAGSTTNTATGPGQLRPGHRVPAPNHLPARHDRPPQEHCRRLERTPYRNEPLPRSSRQHSAARTLSGSTSTVGPAHPSARARTRPGGYLLRRRARRVSRLALTSHCPMRRKRRSPSRQGSRFHAPPWRGPMPT